MNELRLGRYQDVLADVEWDACIFDAPYSARTHIGYDGGAKSSNGADRPDIRDNRARQAAGLPAMRKHLPYTSWSDSDVRDCVGFISPRTKGWIVSITDHDLAAAYASALSDAGRYVFAPVPLVEPGSRVRLTGDGPSSWTCWVVVARPRRVPYSKWGTLPGAYIVPREAKPITGGKPLGAMRDIVRDYSREGDLVCDPCAGAGTTLLAARMEGRAYIGAEADPATHALATRRLAHMPTVPGQPALFGDP